MARSTIRLLIAAWVAFAIARIAWEAPAVFAAHVVSVTASAQPGIDCVELSPGRFDLVDATYIIRTSEHNVVRDGDSIQERGSRGCAPHLWSVGPE